jgi:hypothetical protein
MRSKIKIRTSSPYRANLVLYGDEVRILVFDDPPEQDCKRSGNVRDLDPGRVNCQTRAARPHARAMHNFFLENLRKPACAGCAEAMRQLPTNQVHSAGKVYIIEMILKVKR